MDTITKQRIAAGVFELIRGAGLPEGITDDIAQQVIAKGVEVEDPAMMEAVGRVQKIVAAYYGATDLDTEVAARVMIELIASTNKAKRFILPILEGPGVGHWEMIVRRVRQSEQPGIVIPTTEEKGQRW